MSQDNKKKKITRSGLKNLMGLYRYIKPYRIEYSIGMFFLLGSTAASLVFPKLLGELVDYGNKGELMTQIDRIALILLIVLIAQAVFSYFRVFLFVRVAEKTLADLRQSTYNHLIRLPMRFFLSRRVGELNSRISADITLLQDALTTTLAELLRQLIIIVGGISLMMVTSLKLTLFMLAVVPVIMILVVFFGRYIRSLSKLAQKQVAESNTIVEETLQGIQSVKAFTNEFLEMARYKFKTKEIANTGIRNGKMRAGFSSFIIMGIFGAMVAVIWKGATLIASGELATGELFSFVIYSGFIGGTIGGLADVFARVQKFIGATEDLLEIFNETTEEVDDIKEIPESLKLTGSIRFDHVTFHYPSREETDVLKDISFRIEPDQLVALVGPSGAGKSTLASLLLRLYDPSEGKIYYDDKNSQALPLSIIRNQMAMVPQDIFLFGGTIRENIAYGRPGANEEMIIDAARKANAWEFIGEFPEGLDTIVGERGTQLSGGQRQRIAIARAVLKNPRILILDEATSSLDSNSEKLVQDALEKLMKGRTSIVIAHRLSTIRQADHIIVLNHGKLVEQGTHQELMLLDEGLYKNLNELQFAG
ncbi:MAG TPA: ABC transporter transmembrane domain-containing protein [Bacteroidales bacterium]|nr:ABC transporter transmembrane domain-containing protein [Bacteroidales bacterium]